MIKKWLPKILITVVAGGVIWVLTQSPYSPFARTEVVLTHLQLPEVMIAQERFQVSFQATNQGEQPEYGCHGFVSISPQASEDNSTAEDGAMRQAAAECSTQPSEFFLGGRTAASVQILAHCKVNRAGMFHLTYGVGCADWQTEHRAYIEVEEHEVEEQGES